ncbi:hypothetical protein [Roseitranquillus sediminis]|uniref:hypothetical protein n=1 Tax=Roseitranquillus sediminis TaxID=2809051 RepID=UPI001D0CC52C|nr:hypothetical protein [Roseitranquillus sediminis]MBM9595167.1 hypothetical protein [Roseitranquillus sediminis]
MNGHLFLHLGPPKTATTSLQIGLENVEHPDFVFLGVFQPRNPIRNWIPNALHRHTTRKKGNSEGDNELNSALDQIRDLVARGKKVLISEEMFLVWSEKASFRRKIERLDDLLGNLPRTYIVTLREPGHALPSYYQQIFHSLGIRDKISPKRFFNHERCDCYDYVKVVRLIEGLGRPLRLVEFNAISQNMLNLKNILGDDCSIDAQISIPCANKGSVLRGTGARRLPKITAADLAKRGILRWAWKKVRKKMPAVAPHLRKLAHQITLRESGPRKIFVPEERLAELQKSYEHARR